MVIIATMDAVSWDTVVNAGSTAVLAWLVWHTATKLVPKLIEKHTEAMQNQVEAFERINAEQREEYKTILEADRQRAHDREQQQRQDFKEALDKQIAACEKAN